jgi:hypothetical protein
MGDEEPELDEPTPRIHERRDPLPGGEFALRMLLGDPVRATPLPQSLLEGARRLGHLPKA